MVSVKLSLDKRTLALQRSSRQIVCSAVFANVTWSFSQAFYHVPVVKDTPELVYQSKVRTRLLIITSHDASQGSGEGGEIVGFGWMYYGEAFVVTRTSVDLLAVRLLLTLYAASSLNLQVAPDRKGVKVLKSTSINTTWFMYNV